MKAGWLDRISSGGLAALIVLAPALGGSSHLVALPILVGLSAVGLASLARSQTREGRSLEVPPLALGCFFLAVWTLLQAVPLSAEWLHWLSPRTYELKSFVADPASSWMSLTYEPSATMREVAKYALYGLVVVWARACSRAGRSVSLVTRSVVVASLVSVAIALVHRVLGAGEIFGVLPTRTPIADMMTTFSNPNHAAGFMLLGSLTALGGALSTQERSLRVGYALATIVFAAMIVATGSRGGLIGLGLGLAIFGALLRLGPHADPRRLQLRRHWAILASLAVTMAVGLVFGSQMVRPQDIANDLGPEGKLAAFKDAWPLIRDHLYLGIGRGSYVSTYSAYKSSPAQLTFAYPENIVVQMTSEWGLPLGLLTLTVFCVWLSRAVLRSRHVLEMALLSAVAALLAHNFVDFNLELAGVAVPFFAVLGAATYGDKETLSLRLSRPWSRRSFVLVGVSFSTAALVMAFVLGDMDRDLEDVRSTKASDPNASQVFEAAAANHPSNPFFAATAAFGAEYATPRDLERARRWSNIALFLAPAYADGHLLAGRLSLRLGHREEGLLELRRALTLSNARSDLVDQVIRLCANPDELLSTVPNLSAITVPSGSLSAVTVGSDPNPASVALVVRYASASAHDGYALLRVLQRLEALRRSDWQREVLARLDPSSIPDSILFAITRLALGRNETDLAEKLLDRLHEAFPGPEEQLLRVRFLETGGRYGEARELLEAALPTFDPVNRERATQSLVRLALAEGNWVSAWKGVRELKESWASTRIGQATAASLEAELLLREGNLAGALRVLSTAVELAPERLGLRLKRSQLLMRLGRIEAARVDVAIALRSRPNSGEALALSKRLDAIAREKEGLSRAQGER